MLSSAAAGMVFLPSRELCQMVKPMTEIELNKKIENLLTESVPRQPSRRTGSAYRREMRIRKNDALMRIVTRKYEDYWAMPRNLPRGHEFFIGYYQTQRAIHHHVAFIHTDQSCFLSTHLFDQGYRIFLHFKSGTVTEVGRGENPALPVRIIRENMNLEAPLLAGLLGKLTE